MSQICNIEREPSRVHLLDFPNGKVTLLGIGKKYMNIFDCFKIRYPQFETILYISICSLKVAIHWQLGLLYFQTHTHMAMAQNWDSYPHLHFFWGGTRKKQSEFSINNFDSYHLPISYSCYIPSGSFNHILILIMH